MTTELVTHLPGGWVRHADDCPRPELPSVKWWRTDDGAIGARCRHCRIKGHNLGHATDVPTTTDPHRRPGPGYGWVGCVRCDQGEWWPLARPRVPICRRCRERAEQKLLEQRKRAEADDAASEWWAS
jgi:hypothetical protein